MSTGFELIEEKSLRITEDGFEFKVHSNWYRSLPLSCVWLTKCEIDGKPVPRECIRFVNGDHKYTLEQLAGKVDEYWFVQDPATIQIKLPGSVHAGEDHTLDVEITLKAPYIPVGPGKFLTMPTRARAVQRAM